jgi:hypothetical protein
MTDPLITLALAFNEAHELTHYRVPDLDRGRVDVVQGGRRTGKRVDRVRYVYAVPAGANADRLHEVRQQQAEAFAALADQYLAEPSS